MSDPIKCDRDSPLTELLPAWFTERMMADEWTFGLLLTTGQVMVVYHIEDIRQDAAGDLWLDVEMYSGPLPAGVGEGMRTMTAPTSRLDATVNARHVVAAFELCDR